MPGVLSLGVSALTVGWSPCFPSTWPQGLPSSCYLHTWSLLITGLLKHSKWRRENTQEKEAEAARFHKAWAWKSRHLFFSIGQSRWKACPDSREGK